MADYALKTSTTPISITGTPDGTKFLRDDYAWTAIAAAASNVSTLKTSSLASSTTTSSLPLTGLAFSVDATSSYAFEFGIVFASAATTTGLKLGLTFPAVSTFAASARIPIAGAGAGGEFQGWITASGGVVTGTAVQTASTKYMAYATGVILPSSGGTLQLTYGTEVAGSAVSTFAGSYGRLTIV